MIFDALTYSGRHTVNQILNCCLRDVAQALGNAYTQLIRISWQIFCNLLIQPDPDHKLSIGFKPGLFAGHIMELIFLLKQRIDRFCAVTGCVIVLKYCCISTRNQLWQVWQ
jgi:hypothetical protein